jgi:hypothetical protein
VFIIWGRKTVYRTLGYVADFCPICRDVKPFELKRVGSAGHVYYLSLGEGNLIGYERACQTCDTPLQVEPTVYASISAQIVPLPELTQLTLPNAEQIIGERLAVERMIQQDPFSLSAADRRTLIRSPFLLLSPRVERRLSKTRIDKEIGLALIGAILLLSLGTTIFSTVTAGAYDGIGVIFFVLLSIFLIAWQASTAGRRFMEREIIPLLVTCLSPLKPTETELNAVLSEIGQLKHKMAKNLKLADLKGCLDSPTNVVTA